MECEHCGSTELNNAGYDDNNYHSNVIPNMECKQCGKKSDKHYRPLKTKYDESKVI